MRTVLIVGLVVVALIVGILTVKNMGWDSTDPDSQTSAEQMVDRAEDTKDRVGETVKNIQNRLRDSD